MRLTLIDRGGKTITFERHLRVEGVPGQVASTIKIGAGPKVRLTPEQEEQVRDFYAQDTSIVAQRMKGTLR